MGYKKGEIVGVSRGQNTSLKSGTIIGTSSGDFTEKAKIQSGAQGSISALIEISKEILKNSNKPFRSLESQKKIDKKIADVTRIPSANYHSEFAKIYETMQKNKTNRMSKTGNGVYADGIPLIEKTMLSEINGKVKQGKALTAYERSVLTKYGTAGLDLNATSDFMDFATKNSKGNKIYNDTAIKLLEKQKQGTALTADEQDMLETAKTVSEMRREVLKNTFRLSNDPKQNAHTAVLGAAIDIYSKAAYGTENERTSNAEKNTARAKLYLDTGIESFLSGYATIINRVSGISAKEISEAPENANAIASGALREYYINNRQKFNSVVQDVATNMAQNAIPMLLSAAVGAAGGASGSVLGMSAERASRVVSTASFAPSVFGNAYKEATKSGVTNEGKLLAYATTVTAAECGLESLLGSSINPAGGVLSGEVIEQLSKKVESVALKAVVKIAGNGIGEFTEETIQGLLSPILQKYILNVETETVFDDPISSLSSAAYEGFIGFLSSALMGGVNSVRSAVTEKTVQQNGAYYKNLLNRLDVDINSIAQYFKEISESKDLTKSAENVLNGDTSDMAIGEMLSHAAVFNAESLKMVYVAIGQRVLEDKNGIDLLLSSYETTVATGAIYPENVNTLYEKVKANNDEGIIETAVIGEFASAVQTYAPRAHIMGKLVSEIFGAETEPANTGRDSVVGSILDNGGEDVSELKEIIERLSNDEDVSIEEIIAAPLIEQIEKEISERKETYTIDTPERNALRQKIVERITENGSYTGIDGNGNEVYNGDIEQGHRVDIVIELSAAGKSSVLVNPLSEAHAARVIDSDMAKTMLPEFDNGLGASAVHKESQEIIEDVQAESVKNGDNIVYPIVGGNNVNSLIDKIQYFKDNGYSVHLHLNELSNNKALGRALNRFLETGRYIPPDIIKAYGDTPTRNFYTVINTEGLTDGYSHYSNDVARGEKPILIEASENDRKFNGRLLGQGKTSAENRQAESGETGETRTDAEGLTDGYSHYSNDVARGERPILIEASENDRKFNERLLGRGKTSAENRQAESGETGETRTDAEGLTEVPEDSDGEGVFREPPAKEIYRPLTAEDHFKRMTGGEVNSKMKQAEDVVAKLGLSLRWSKRTENGYFDRKNNMIVLNPEQTMTAMYVTILKHEFCHRLESKRLYNSFFRYVYGESAQFKEYCKERYAKETGTEFEGSAADAVQWAVDRTKETYRQELPESLRANVTEAYAKQELLADFVGDVLLGGSDTAATMAHFEELAQKNRNVLERLRDFIRELIAKIKGDPHYLTLQEDLEYLDQYIARVFKSADKKSALKGGEVKYSFAGYAEDGKGKYKSNFPKGTPKAAKTEKILSYIQDVWSKKPIKLNITDNKGNVIKTIEAHFDATYDENGNIRTDASKLMGGNRHGTAAEQRVTLDLADDYYRIAAESKYNYSKAETGKDNYAHKDVTQWHYFVNDIYFSEYGSKDYEPYRVSINVKEKPNGNFVYSFSAEKQKEHSTHQTLHADVNNENNSVANAKFSEDIISKEDMSVKNNISENAENYSENADKKSALKGGEVKYSLRPGAEADVEKALREKNYTEDVYLTESSPSIIASQKGTRNLPMLMKASHIRENVFTEQEAKGLGLKVDEHTHYHGLGKTLFLKIIDGLNDVKRAYRGTENASNPSRRENYFLLISQYKDANGNTVNVPVYIDEKGQYNRVFIDTNKIATVFGRDNFSSYIQKEIKNGNLVRIKNKSTQASELTALIAGSYSKNAFDDNNIPHSDNVVKNNISENAGNYSEKLNETEISEFKYLFDKALTAAGKEQNVAQGDEKFALAGGKVKNAKKNKTPEARYWFPDMSESEIVHVRRIAKEELSITDNYLDEDNKWLYNEKNGNNYFALYSTADLNEPTVLYACKGKRAEFEHRFLSKSLEKEVDNNGNIYSRTEIIEGILGKYGYVISGTNVNNSNVVGERSNGRNAGIYSKNPRNRPSEALLNCLQNIREIQKRSEQDRVAQLDNEVNKNISESAATYSEVGIDKLLSSVREQSETNRQSNKKDILRRTIGFENEQKQIEQLTAKLGMNLRWDTQTEAGYYEKGSNTVVINPNHTVGQAYIVIFKHEFCHRLEIKEMYGEFFRYVYEESDIFGKYCRDIYKDVMGRKFSGTDADAVSWAVKYIKDLYARKLSDYAVIDEYYAKQELLADFVGDVLLGGHNIGQAEQMLDVLSREDITLEALNELAKKNRTLFEQLRDFIREIIAKITGDPRYSALKAELEHLNGLIGQVYRSDDLTVDYVENADGGIAALERKHLFIKEKNQEKCREAEKYERAGKSREYIWKKLNIVRDNEGNWMTEINDENAMFFADGDALKSRDREYLYFKLLSEEIELYGGIEKYEKGELILTEKQQEKFEKWLRLVEILGKRYGIEEYKARDPEYIEYNMLKKLIDKYESDMETIIDENGDLILSEEQLELFERRDELYDIIENRYTFQRDKLKNFFRHDELFEMFPQLPEMRFIIEDVEEMIREGELVGSAFEDENKKMWGGYDFNNDMIILDMKFFEKNRDNETLMRQVLLHEIQHKLQHDEKRPRGSDINMWEKIQKDFGVDKLPYYNSKKRIMQPMEAYRLTAGEIEAMSACYRYYMTDTERKQKLPDYKWEDAVSAEEYREKYKDIL